MIPRSHLENYAKIPFLSTYIWVTRRKHISLRGRNHQRTYTDVLGKQVLGHIARTVISNHNFPFDSTRACLPTINLCLMHAFNRTVCIFEKIFFRLERYRMPNLNRLFKQEQWTGSAAGKLFACHRRAKLIQRRLEIEVRHSWSNWGIIQRR